MDLISVPERISSLENCPWCSSKGQVNALRSYRLNFQESITLCTNPKCLFPLVSRSLEDVLAELVPAKEQIGGKRKNGHVLQSDGVAASPPKRLRSDGGEQALAVTGSPVTQEEPAAMEVDGKQFDPLQETREKALICIPPSEGLVPSEAACRGWDAERDSEDVLVPTCSPAKPTAGEAALASASPLSPDGVCGATGATSPRRALEVKDETPTDVLFRPPHGLPREALLPCNVDVPQWGEPVSDPVDYEVAFPPPADESAAREPPSPGGDGTRVLTGAAANKIKPGPPSATTPEQADPAPSPADLPPRPAQALPVEEPAQLVELVALPPRLFWKNTDNLCWLDTLLIALVSCRSLRDRGLRDRPQESPVWELVTRYDETCAAARAHQVTGTDGVERVPRWVLQKAYSDLDSIRMSVFRLLQPKLQCRLGRRETPVFALPVLVGCDSWAEGLFEQAFHWAFECSGCQGVSNMRVSKPLPTFTGLVPDWHPDRAAHLAPCNMCHKKNQRRTMVLDRVPPVFALHFVDGLPSSQLQAYSFSRCGSLYSVSTVIQYDQTIKHFVAWTRTPDGLWQEFDDLKHPSCSRHVTLPVPAQEMHIVFWEVDTAAARQPCSATAPDPGPTPAQSPDQSLLPLYDDGDIAAALALSTDGAAAATREAAVDLDASIGSTTLLDTFEGLSHSDIVTLTLVEVKVDAEGRVVAAADHAPERGSPDTSGVPPDPLTPPEAPGEVDSNSAEHLSSDPTFDPQPGKRKRRGRGKARGGWSAKGRQQKVKTEKTPKTPKTSPVRRAPAKRSKKAVSEPAVTTPPVQEAPPDPAAPLSAAVVSSPPSQKSAGPLPMEPVQQARWAFMTSRQSQPQAKGSPADPSSQETPAAAPKKTRGKASAARRAGTPLPAAKPQLRRENGELPMKHASMYDSFSVNCRTTSAPSPLPSPPPSPVPCGGGSNGLPHAPSPSPPAPPTKVAFPAPGATQLPKAVKHDRLSGGPAGLDTTDVLRSKLLKKLKAKKRKLDALNQLLGRRGGSEATSGPDSTEQSSPQVVSSSTAPAACHDFFPEWLSPASTASHLSPDSSGLPEARPAGAERPDPAARCPPGYSLAGGEDDDDPLEELLSGMAAHVPAAEPRDLRELDPGAEGLGGASTAFDNFDIADLFLF